MTTRLVLAAALALLSTRVAAQILPPTRHAARVRILEKPKLELATDHLAIVRWTTDNPGGADVHYGVIHYGTDPANLGRTARSPIRLNRGHRRTTFRVRLDDIEPQTTYYFRLVCEENSGVSDGVRSATYEFTTPALGERVAANPRLKRRSLVQSPDEKVGFRGFTASGADHEEPRAVRAVYWIRVVWAGM